jgi:HAD superfamily hydrolase (TIGR01549 family)
MEILEMINEKYDLIIWDFDGTIVKLHISWPDFKKKLAMLCDYFGLSYSQNYYNHLLYTLESAGYKKEAYEFIEKMESSADYSVIDPAVDVIRGLTDKKQVVFSDNLEKTITSILDELHIIDYFDKMVTKNHVEKYKPDSEGAEIIFKMYPGIDKTKILYIGDTWKDETIAKNTTIQYLDIKQLQ